MRDSFVAQDIKKRTWFSNDEDRDADLPGDGVLVDSALDRASRQSRNDLFLEEHKRDERWNCYNNHICEKQVPLRRKLTYKAIQGQLDSYVL